MAKQVKLKAETRTATGRSAARKLKAQGAIPAVVYGGREKPQALQVSARDVNAMLSHASGENILVELQLDGGNKMALVQEIQHAPLGGNVLHIDFHAVKMDEKINADVPLESTGMANGVKNFGGLLEQSLRTLSIECLPTDLPDRITVDVSELNIGDAIHVRDIKLPNGVVAKVQPDLTAFSSRRSGGGRGGRWRLRKEPRRDRKSLRRRSRLKGKQRRLHRPRKARNSLRISILRSLALDGRNCLPSTRLSLRDGPPILDGCERRASLDSFGCGTWEPGSWSTL